MLWTSHNMYEVEEVCDRVLFLSRGKILLEGDPKTLPREHGKETLEELFIAVAREPLALGEGAHESETHRAIVLRQFYLLRGSPARILPLFAWVAIDIVLWGFITRYLNTRQPRPASISSRPSWAPFCSGISSCASCRE